MNGRWRLLNYERQIGIGHSGRKHRIEKDLSCLLIRAGGESSANALPPPRPFHNGHRIDQLAQVLVKALSRGDVLVSRRENLD